MPRRLTRDERGTAVVEFALVAPLMLTILMGIVAYGDYFWMAHGLQQAANDGARASIAGLTTAERRTLSQDAANRVLSTVGGINRDRTATLVDDNGSQVSISVRYDASQNAVMRMSLVPLPSATISRSATMQLDGI